MRRASILTTERYYLRHRAVDQAERIARRLEDASLQNCTQKNMGTPADSAKENDSQQTAASRCESKSKVEGGWVSTYRTLLTAPDFELRQLLEQVATFRDAG